MDSKFINLKPKVSQNPYVFVFLFVIFLEGFGLNGKERNGEGGGVHGG